MYGHVEKLAEEIKKGATSVEGVEAKLWQVCVCTQIMTYFTSYLLFSVSDEGKTAIFLLAKVDQFLLDA